MEEETRLASASESVRGKLPDFLVIGAQRAGTTLFYRLLCRHPLIVSASRKEVHYFDRDYCMGEEHYRSLFRPPQYNRRGRERLTGEATPYYLFHPLSPPRAATLVPNARLIVLLRNPIERAYSHYHHERKVGVEPIDTFEEAVNAERQRLEGEEEKIVSEECWSHAHSRYSYLSRGVYADQILRWQRHFGENGLLILKSETFFQDPDKVLKRAHNYLGLWPFSTADVIPEARNSVDYQPMRPDTRERLKKYFEPHNQRLYELLGEDFNWQ